MASKDVKYFEADFDSLNSNLKNFARAYFPDTYNDFTPASPGTMFIEMASYVGDVLGFEINRAFNENFIDRATERKNIYEIASTFGYKPTLGTSANGTISVYQQIPASGSGLNVTPDFRYGLVVDAGMTVSSRGGIQFLTQQPIDFRSSQSAEISVYSVDSTGEPTYYLVKKDVPIKSGRVKTQTFTLTDPEKYLELTLNDDNIVSVTNVQDSSGNTWYEVPYLAQDTVFLSLENTYENAPELYVHADETPFLLTARKTSKRFKTYINKNEKVVLQFGAGMSANNDEQIVPNPTNIGLGINGSDSEIAQAFDPSNFLFTKTYGEVPQNTTLTVTYLVGYGTEANLASSEITNIVSYNANFQTSGLDASKSNVVLASLQVNNARPATGGRYRDSLENVRQGSLGALHAQRRAVTKEDYVIRTLTMPARFGKIAKAWIERNPTDQFTLDLYVLGMDANGNLTTVNAATKRNLKNYLSAFRLITDSINIRDGIVVNIGVRFEISVLPRYNQQEVLLKCIDVIKSALHIDNMQFKQPLIMHELVSKLALVQGVQTIPTPPIIYIKNDAGYSPVYYPINSAYRNGIVYPSYDPSVFEVKFPNVDIEGRVRSLL